MRTARRLLYAAAMERFRSAVAAALIAAWLGVAYAWGYDAHTLLRDRLGFTNSDLALLTGGRAVVKSLKSESNGEIAVAGAIRVDVPPEFFLSRFTNIAAFKQSEAVLQIGKFSEPPRIDDLDGLTFESAELDSLRTCKPGHCGIQLGADQIQQLSARLDWSKPDARAQTNAVLRELLLEYVRAYRARGNAALMEYRAAARPVKVAEELQALVGHSSVLMKDVPEFQDYLLATKDGVLPNAEGFIYWSKEQFGLKPVVSMTHVIIYRPGRPTAPDFIVAHKQIYASRYVTGSLALTLGMDDGRDGLARNAFYMLYNNRTMTIPAPFLLGSIIRRTAENQTHSRMDKELRLTQERLERDFAAK